MNPDGEGWQDTDALDEREEREEREADDYWKEEETI